MVRISLLNPFPSGARVAKALANNALKNGGQASEAHTKHSAFYNIKWMQNGKNDAGGLLFSLAH